MADNWPTYEELKASERERHQPGWVDLAWPYIQKAAAEPLGVWPNIHQRRAAAILDGTMEPEIQQEHPLLRAR